MPDEFSNVIISHVVVIENGVNDIDAECYVLTVKTDKSYTLNAHAGHTIHGYVWVWGDVWISPSSSFTVTRNLWVWPVGEVILLPKGNLQINGSTTNSGNILLNSDASGTASFIPVGSYSGDDNVLRKDTYLLSHMFTVFYKTLSLVAKRRMTALSYLFI